MKQDPMNKPIQYLVIWKKHGREIMARYDSDEKAFADSMAKRNHGTVKPIFPDTIQTDLDQEDEIWECQFCGYISTFEHFDTGEHTISYVVGDEIEHYTTDDPICPKCGSREIRPYIQDPDAEDQ